MRTSVWGCWRTWRGCTRRFTAAALLSIYVCWRGSGRVKAEEQHALFEGVIGLESVKEELNALRDMLENRDRYVELGAKLPRGILLVGPPGVGKTHLVRALAKDAGFTFIYRSGADFDTMLAGQGAQRVKEVFAEARDSQPAIVFIDEFDTLAAKRSMDAMSDATINQLLVEMDGFSERDSVVVVAATNMEDTLDAAALRSGRFDKRVYFDLPGPRDRRRLLEFYLRRVPHRHIELEEAAGITTGFSPAQIRNLVNVAARLAVRARKPAVDEACLMLAFDHLGRGGAAHGHLLGRDRWRLALHHAAHAVVALQHPELRLLTTSILPAGQTLGHTRFVGRADDAAKATAAELLGRMDALLAGHVLERLLFGGDGFSSGCGRDLPAAAQLARDYLLSSGAAPTELLALKDAKGLSPEGRNALDRRADQLLRQRALSVAQSLSLGLRQVVEVACLLCRHESVDAAELDQLLTAR